MEPVIARDVWEEVQRVGRSRSLQQHDKDHPRRIVSPFVLSGVLYCQECGSPMSGYTVKRWSYYVCSRRQRRHDCRSRRIPSAPIEAEVTRLLTERMLTIENLLHIQTEIQNAWVAHSAEHEQARRETEKQLTGIQRRIRNITEAISDMGHSPSLLKQLTDLEAQQTECRSALDKLSDASAPRTYTRPQLAQIAEAVRAELNSDDINKKRVAIRGIVARVIAKRTDDQIVGVLHCNQVNGHVPPRGSGANDLLYPIQLKIKKHKAPVF